MKRKNRKNKNKKEDFYKRGIFVLIIIFIISLIVQVWSFYKINKITGYVTSYGVLDICINYPPIIIDIGSQNATEEELFTLYIIINATDNNLKNITANTTLFNISIVNVTAGLINFTPSNGDVGNYTINVTATDDSTCSNNNYSTIFNLTVIPMNYPPVLDPIGTQKLRQKQLYYYDVNASDEDNDTLTFYDNTTLFDINSSTGIITFTPTQNDSGAHYVNISVKDSYNATDWEVVLYNITDVNDAPVLDPIGNQTAYAPILFTLNVTASDLDNDNLTFYDNATFFDITTVDPASGLGLINFTPSLDDVGNHSIIITVSDNYNDSCCTDNEIILFTILPWNYAPDVTVIYPNGNEIIYGTINLTATSTDANGNDTIKYVNFYYSNDGGNNWTFLGNDTYDNDINYNYTWDTTSVADGYKYRIKVNTSDGEKTDEDISGNMFFINNIDQEPIWDNFKYDLTTNFTLLWDDSIIGEFTNISNVTIGIPDKGLINFSGHYLFLDGVNLDANVNISHALIGINVSELWMLNVFSTLTFYNITFLNPKILMDGVECQSDVCKKVRYSNNEFVMNVTGFGTYNITEGANASLDIWDDTDLNLTYANESVEFYANYTNVFNWSAINGTNVSCKIKFNITGEYTTPENMSFNYSSLLYEYNKTFESRGNYSWNVLCNGSALGYEVLNETDSVTITNTPPRLIKTIPDKTWNEDTSVVNWIDLDDYFFDIDGDTLSYTNTPVSNIAVSIDSYNRVSLVPESNWHGIRTVVFTCNDSINATRSNDINLIVLEVSEAAPAPSAAAGAGGGVAYICEEDWNCSSWTICYKNEIQTRVCTDLNKCRREEEKPEEVRSCIYDQCKNEIMDLNEEGIDCGGPCEPCPTCDDGIKNCHHGSCEILIDCGGPCGPCPTCDDEMQNQGETGVDCGGPCPPCSSCYDGVQNHGETGIDCGGPCPECKFLEKPALVTERSMIILILLILIISLLILAALTKAGSLFIDKVILRYYAIKGAELMRRRYIKAITLFRLQKIEDKLYTRPIEASSKDFVFVMTEFFKEWFEVKRFSYEELTEKIKKNAFSIEMTNILKSLVGDIIVIKERSYKSTAEEMKLLIRKSLYAVNLISRGIG